jgi:hypothetical protein
MSEEKLSVQHNGTKLWFKDDGLCHREGGPAIEYADGTKIWCMNGKFHRLDGPAIEDVNGTIEWYLNGEQYSFEEFLAKLPVEDAILVALEWK